MLLLPELDLRNPESQSIFELAWLRYSNSENPHIITLIEDIEQQLGLRPGFLASDELILDKINRISQNDLHVSSKSDMLTIVVNALSDIKIMDITRNKVYGDFSDEFETYQDDHDNLLYRSPRVKIPFGSPLDVESVSSFQSRFYESDETSSLMKCDSYMSKSPSMLELSPEDLDEKFKLHKVLEDLRSRHAGISLSFMDIDTKLADIKEQNGKDLEFLDKLTANSELIRDRMQDMRSEIDELTSAVDKLKREKEGEAKIKNEKDKEATNDENDDLIGTENSDDETLHSTSPRLEVFPTMPDTHWIIEKEEKQRETKAEEESKQLENMEQLMMESNDTKTPKVSGVSLTLLVLLLAIITYRYTHE